jgi:hypothetical protein
MFPNAVILNIMRDSMDTLFSCYRNRFVDREALPWVHTKKSIVEEYM